MRIAGPVLAAAILVCGCKIDVLGDMGSGTPTCRTDGCGVNHARLLVAVPMSDERAQRTDLWVSVCHAGACANDVHLEWTCTSANAMCDLACSSNAELLGGRITVRRGGACTVDGLADRLCVELDLPTGTLGPGNTEVALKLDDAISGRRLVDQPFTVELAETSVETCTGVKTCLEGERQARIAAFDPATALAGDHHVTLETPAISVSAGERHSCGTRGDGSLSCWGELPGPAGQEIVPAGLFQSVGAGYLLDCALGLDGVVTCFGNASLAERGLLPPPGRFREIAVGPAFACGVRASGRVECWGGHACELGRSTSATEVDHIVVSSSGETLCALRSDGSARCSGGWNLTLPDAVRVGVSTEHLCRLAADGSAHCRRSENDTESSQAGPFVDLVVGADHACGLGRDGRVTCWGDNAALDAATPALAFTRLSSSKAHVCGVTSAGGVACWGDDENGESSPPSDFP